MIAIDRYHDEEICPFYSLMQSPATHSPTAARSLMPESLGVLLRFHPRQRHDTVHDILERLLVLLGRITRRLGALNFLPVVPLNLKCGQDDARVEAVDILVGVCGQAFQGADYREKLVDVVAR